jgi:hypothetical protein
MELIWAGVDNALSRVQSRVWMRSLLVAITPRLIDFLSHCDVLGHESDAITADLLSVSAVRDGMQPV